MPGPLQVSRAGMPCPSLQKFLAFTRVLVLLVFIQSFSPLRLIASAAKTREFCPGSVDMRSERGFATIIPLREGTSALRGTGSNRRRLLVGDARMDLHDDLLSKGYYTSSVHIGTPPREFSLIVDTGSTVTYVPCSTCTHCGQHQDPWFKPADSSSYESISCTSTVCNTGVCGENKQCKYERQYAESSTSAGLLGKDRFGFGDNSSIDSPKLLFGCENAETGELYNQAADGIMGLGRGPLSIVDQLVQGKEMSDTFSLCYGGMNEMGGHLIMGDFPTPPGMKFTTSNPQRSVYYNVELKEIRVAGVALPVDHTVFDARYGTVLDSGTTYAYLPERAFNAFKRAVIEQLGNLQAVAGPEPDIPDLCFQGAGTDVTKLSEYFPAVDIVFGDGMVLPLEPENYLFKHTGIPGAYCLGIFKNDNDHTTLLGGILVRNVLVKYDRANQQIGFWRTKCTDLWSQLEASHSSNNHQSPPPQDTRQSSPPPPVIPEDPMTDFNMSITEEHIGGLELNISVVTNYSTFSIRARSFVEDMARDFQLEIHQVKLLAVKEDGPDVAVTCAVSPASDKAPLPSSTVQNIIGRLRQHQVQFGNDFQSYHLNNWRLIPEKKSEWAGSSVAVVLGIVGLIALVSLGGAYFVHRRSRDRTYNARYVTVGVLGDDGSEQL